MSRQRGGSADRAPDDPRYRFLARFGSVILSGGIAAVPRALYYYQAELGLLPQEVWFVGYILAHRWTAELPYPSLRKMARRTGVTYQMLHRYKNSLIAKNYLEVLPRTRQNGGRTTNSYDFTGLFQAIEDLLLRDRGVMDDALDATEPDPADADSEDRIDPGQPELMGPGRLPLTRSGKPRLTAPDQPGRTTRKDPEPHEQSFRREGSRRATTTTKGREPAGHTGENETLIVLYAAANGRPPSPVQTRALEELAAELDGYLGPGQGAGWVADAIREAADAGSHYLSPRLVRRICERWLHEGRPAARDQSVPSQRTANQARSKDWMPLSVEMWTAAVDRLAGTLSPANFQAFVAPVRPIGVDGDRVCLAVPDDLTAQRLTGAFRSAVEAALTAEIGRRMTVECRVGRTGDGAGRRDRDA
jgi:hypothetical protein